AQEVFEGALVHISTPVTITANLMEILPSEGFRNGATYWATVKYLPPGPIARSLFGEPDTASFVYRDLIGFTNPNQGFAFSMISEAYLNFGWVGLFAIPGAFGLILGYTYRRSSAEPTRAIHLAYPVLIALLPYLYRSDSLVQAKLFGYSMIVIHLVYRTSTLKRRPSANRD
ncbi:MAG: O-antigen polysaccharide polymerase Wzy, partial [Rhodothermia bacterium]|nr:O-antigen polysaccharide polymerase Wzy [Rhodothermia bacterium]